MGSRRGNCDTVPAEECEHHHHKGGGDVVLRNPQCSLITIRHDIPPPVIFPPINHENLHGRLSIFPSPSESESDSETTSSVSTFSPPSSPGSSLAPTHFPLIKSTRRITLVEIMAVVSSMMRSLWGYLVKWRSVILNFRTIAFVAAVLCVRERRRSKSIVAAVKQRDEKIKKLLDQISQMNQMLLSYHRSEPIKAIGTNV